jgi:hypothetical protein
LSSLPTPQFTGAKITANAAEKSRRRKKAAKKREQKYTSKYTGALLRREAAYAGKKPGSKNDGI